MPIPWYKTVNSVTSYFTWFSWSYRHTWCIDDPLHIQIDKKIQDFGWILSFHLIRILNLTLFNFTSADCLYSVMFTEYAPFPLFHVHGIGCSLSLVIRSNKSLLDPHQLFEVEMWYFPITAMAIFGVKSTRIKLLNSMGSDLLEMSSHGLHNRTFSQQSWSSMLISRNRHT